MAGWRGNRRFSPPASAIVLIGHLTDPSQTFANRNATFIQRGVERLAGGDVHLSVKLPSGDIKVWARNDAQAERLREAVIFSVPSAQSGGQVDLPVRFTPARTQKVQGLVYAPNARDESEQDLAAILASQGVSSVRRLPPRGRHSDGALLVLTFTGADRPEHVNLLYERLSTRPFVQYPLRCNRCQRYRHHARFCSRPIRCGRCAGSHLTEGCNSAVPKCAACDGAHTVKDSRCEVWRTEFLLNKWMVVDGLSLAEARERLRAQSGEGTVGNAATPASVQASERVDPVRQRADPDSPQSQGAAAPAGTRTAGAAREQSTRITVSSRSTSFHGALGSAAAQAGPWLTAPRRRIQSGGSVGATRQTASRSAGSSPLRTSNRWSVLADEDDVPDAGGLSLGLRCRWAVRQTLP